MRKWSWILVLTGIVAALTACGNAQDKIATATATNELPLEEQLLVGTFELESTDLAVSSSQASQLLPLWETLYSLETSSTAASQEIDALVSQIESSMSAEQISNITAMNLNQQDLAASIVDHGAASTTSNTADTATASPVQVQPGAGAPGDGVVPDENPPPDMGGSSPSSTGLQAIGQAVAGTGQAATTDQTSSTKSQISPALIRALIELLKTKTA